MLDCWTSKDEEQCLWILFRIFLLFPVALQLWWSWTWMNKPLPKQKATLAWIYPLVNIKKAFEHGPFEPFGSWTDPSKNSCFAASYVQGCAPQWCLLVFKPHQVVRYITNKNHSGIGLMFTNLAHELGPHLVNVYYQNNRKLHSQASRQRPSCCRWVVGQELINSHPYSYKSPEAQGFGPSHAVKWPWWFNGIYGWFNGIYWWFNGIYWWFNEI